MNRLSRDIHGVMRWHPLILLVWMFLLLGLSTSRGADPDTSGQWYVSESGSDTLGDGSLGNPFASITYAISVAASLDTVIVLPGRYVGNIDMDSSKFVHLRSQDGATVTTIEGGVKYDGSSSDDRVLLKGFRIVNGTPGIFASNVSPDILECVIDSCTSSAFHMGGGIVLLNSLAFVTDCSITNCAALFKGGGIYFAGSAPKIQNCRILMNSVAAGDGGGIYADTSSNSTHRPLIANCIIIGNQSGKGGGIYSAGNGQIYNNLIADNNATTTGSGVLIDIGAASEIYNNIVAFNLGEGIRCESAVDGVTGNNCFFGNGGTDLIALCNDLDGNVFADPLLVNYSTGDYHLQDGSPCINGGLNLDSLPLTDFDGESRIAQDTVDIGPDEYSGCNFSADFSATPTSGCPPLSVQFDAQLQGDYDSLYWSFGDGSFETNLTQVFHTYDSIGLYTVSLHAVTSCTTAVVVKENMIDASGLSSADFTASPMSGCPPLSVQFDAQIQGDYDSLYWSFGDGSFETNLTQVFHTYTDDGSYSVSLNVITPCTTAVISKSNLIEVTSTPNVDFTAVPTTGCPHTSVRFNALVTGDYDSLYWDFGDGSDAANLTQVFHTYSETGIYTVSLLAVTPCTTAVVVRDSLINIGEIPTANFSTDVDSGCAPLTVQFTDLSEGAPISWLWDFGDGETSTEQSPVHEYTQGGNHTVTLTVTNNCSEDELTMQNLIFVAGNAEVNFSAQPVLGAAPLTVQFSDSTANDPLEWLWDFGDGSTSNDQNPQHTYQEAGFYDVMLSSVNVCGEYDTLIRSGYVTVTGFKTALIDTTNDRFVKTFSILYDTLYGLYDRTIDVKVKAVDQPERGNVLFTLSTNQVNVFDTVFVTASISEDMSAGLFRYNLISTAVGGGQADTTALEIMSNPITLISTSMDTLVFDSTQVGDEDTIIVLINNISDSSQLYISSVAISGSSAFDVTWNPGTIYHTSSMPLPVIFTPTDTGEFLATMEVVSDDPVEPSIEIFLTGRAISERVMPTVIYHYPTNLATDVPFTISIDVDLSEAITFDSPYADSLMTVESEAEGRVAGEIQYITTIPNRWILRFTPDSSFEPLDWVHVTVSGNIMDLAGNSLDGNLDGVAEGSPADDTTFSFRTSPGVYPGDANNDGVVNEIDVLPIGVFWMMEGPERDGNDAEWVMRPVPSWDSLGATYADCDGNGIVNELDLLMIGFHWGQRHDHASPVFTEDDYDLRKYRSAFEAMYLSMSGAPDNDANRRILSILGRYVTEDVGPSNFILSQNYPNPFNPTTYIQYNMPVECHVTLTIHNILGQTVAVLVDEYQPAGYKRVAWNGTSDSGENLPSGIYFYKLTAGSFSQVGKMMMLR